MESSSFYGSSKRAKAPGYNSVVPQVVRCLVDGCNADLSLCRDYHRRHKVCEVHSKTPRVTIEGREQRFCQQCSRFHSLVEFDEGKRSCRKRLDGHNRRRRKSQPDSNISRNHGLVLSTQPTRLLSFSTPQIVPTSIESSSSWSSMSKKPENDITWPQLDRQNPFSAPSYNQLQFFQSSDVATYDTNAGPNNSNEVLSSQQQLNQVVDCDGALSLLSSATTQLAQTERLLPQSQSFLQYGSSSSGSGQYYYPFVEENKVVVSSADSHHSHHASTMVHFSAADTARHGHEGSSASGSHQTLSFMWE